MKNKADKLTKKLLIIITILLCSIGVGYTVYKIDLNKKIAEEARILAEENRINALKPSKDVYICLNEEIEFSNVSRFDEKIISLSQNGDKYIIKGLKVGFTDVYDETTDSKTRIYVSDLFDLPHIDNNKTPVPCHAYSTEQAHYLDRVLAYKINEAGYQTRAGVVAAARFLSMQFKYRILYFYENGRLNNGTGHPYADGEGRYYHKGLYLSDDKYADVVASDNGQGIWGCEIYETGEERMYPNGIDCSGFVSWALLNGGFDPDDIGGGNGYNTKDYTLLSLGKNVLLTELDFSQLKAGDFIEFPGHIGMIIGIDGDTIHIVQAFWDNDLEVITFTKDDLIKSEWEAVILMDEYYKSDGNYTTMWK